MGKTTWFRRYRYRADAIRCEDMDLLFRACAGSRFANLPEIVLGYRQSSINLRKCLRSRWMWCRCAGHYLNRAGRLRVGAVEVLKELPRHFSSRGTRGYRMAAIAIHGAHRRGIARMAASLGLGIMSADRHGRSGVACAGLRHGSGQPARLV